MPAVMKTPDSSGDERNDRRDLQQPDNQEKQINDKRDLNGIIIQTFGRRHRREVDILKTKKQEYSLLDDVPLKSKYFLKQAAISFITFPCCVLARN